MTKRRNELKHPFTCEQCGGAGLGYRLKQRFCSRACKQKFMIEQRRQRNLAGEPAPARWDATALSEAWRCCGPTLRNSQGA